MYEKPPSNPRLLPLVIYLALNRTALRGLTQLIDALIFDFDGLIIDTETPEYESWQEIFHSFGVALELDVWEGFIGRGFGSFDVYQHLADLSGRQIDREAIRPMMRKRYLERIERNPVLPGVERCIRRARELGMRLAVASSSRGGWASGHLERRGLLHNFELLLSGDDVANVKPDPEIYTLTAQRLGVSPQNALAIEDSFNGLAAAKAAGLYCVVVPNPMTKHMDFSAADLRLNALSDVTLDDMLARLNLQD